MKTIKLSLDGETPAKKNSRLTLPNGRNIPSKRYREWHSGVAAQVLQQWANFFHGEESTIDYPVMVTLHFYHGDKRRRDSDNGTSSILDLLQDCRLLKDDCWQIVREIHVVNEFEKGKARCEILIDEYKGE